jgi:hypothetical protein
MYSIKPGRGPSLMGAVIAIVVAAFGVFWTVGALGMGAPPIFALFGIIFVVIVIVSGVAGLYNAVSRNRFSTYDITTDEEESDPIAEALDLHPNRRRDHREPEPSSRNPRRVEGGFCPYCGEAVDDDFDFCPKCGKDI